VVIDADIVAHLAGALAARPGMTAKELITALGLTGLDATKSEINSALYRAKDRFWHDGGTPPRWQLITTAPAPPPEPVAHPTITPGRAVAPQLYKWQEEALEAWVAADCCGVVEAVTGTGKTKVGITAAVYALSDGGRVQVIVPSKELLRQWRTELSRIIPDARVGQLGDGQLDTWESADIIVSIVNSAARYDLGDPGPGALLIADECHRYGSEMFARALDERFDLRLGLSATYTRSDDGNDEYLDPYFGDTCFRIGYARAIADNVTAHFKVALIGVPFASGERAEYEEANKAANSAQKWLIDGGWARKEPFGEFMKDVTRLAEGDHGRATWKARNFLSNFAGGGESWPSLPPSDSICPDSCPRCTQPIAASCSPRPSRRRKTPLKRSSQASSRLRRFTRSCRRSNAAHGWSSSPLGTCAPLLHRRFSTRASISLLRILP
jgi:RNA polymerase primary sigma factor